jgi:hypothetical protein
MLSHHQLGLEHLFIRMAISTSTSLFFTFLLTVSDPSSHSMTVSLMSLAGLPSSRSLPSLLISFDHPVVFVLELYYILLGTPLPSFLLPSLTPYDLFSIAHSFQPAIMHCSRSIFGSLYVNPLSVLSQGVSTVCASQKLLNGKLAKIVRQIQNSSKTTAPSSVREAMRTDVPLEVQGGRGVVNGVLDQLLVRVGKESPQDPTRGVERVKAMVSRCQEAISPLRSIPFPLWYLGVYLAARWLLYTSEKIE